MGQVAVHCGQEDWGASLSLTEPPYIGTPRVKAKKASRAHLAEIPRFLKSALTLCILLHVRCIFSVKIMF